jgi:hypothetical protein
MATTVICPAGGGVGGVAGGGAGAFPLRGTERLTMKEPTATTVPMTAAMGSARSSPTTMNRATSASMASTAPSRSHRDWRPSFRTATSLQEPADSASHRDSIE